MKGRNTKKTTEEFIYESKLKHGEYYDYSETKYINAKTKIVVKCPRHGLIEQFPNNHIRHGCKFCSKEKIIPIDLVSEYDGLNYQEEYDKLINNARNNIPNDNYEIHHIKPKSMFPELEFEENNLVKLTFEDHYRAHYLLYKIYNNQQMINAFFLMLNGTNRKYNPELFEKIKQKIVLNSGRKVYCLEDNKEYISLIEAAKENNLKSSTRILNACNNFLRTSAGKHWCYLEDKEKAMEIWNEQI